MPDSNTPTKSESLNAFQEIGLHQSIRDGKPIRILSIDGGGYLGLATASFIKTIEEHFGRNLASVFDLFCGSSTGAIIALALAQGRTGAQLEVLYKDLGPRVFSVLQRQSLLGICRPLYRNGRLRQALADEFKETTLGDIYRRDKTALITAFNVTTGSPCIFKTDHSENLSRDSQRSLVDVAMASSAAPYYFPLVRLTNPITGVREVFCDGGVVANHPALLGFAEAVSEFGARPEQVKILSLSTPITDLGEGPNSRRSLSRGIGGWRKTLASVFIDSNARAADETLKRLVRSYAEDRRPAYERIEMPNKRNLAMDRVTKGATEELVHIGVSNAETRNRREQVSSIIT